MYAVDTRRSIGTGVSHAVINVDVAAGPGETAVARAHVPEMLIRARPMRAAGCTGTIVHAGTATQAGPPGGAAASVGRVAVAGSVHTCCAVLALVSVGTRIDVHVAQSARKAGVARAQKRPGRHGGIFDAHTVGTGLRVAAAATDLTVNTAVACHART